MSDDLRAPVGAAREDLGRFLTDEGRAKVAAFVAECEAEGDDFDLNEVIARNLADHAAVYDNAPEPASRSGIASRINQVAVAQATVRPDMDPERFTELLLQKRTPTSLDLALIADAFKVTVPWLVTGDDHAWCEDTLTSLHEELVAERCRTAELKQALVRMRAAHARCPGAHVRIKTYFSEDEGCDLTECSCGWTYDAEETCPGIGGDDA